MIYLNKKKLDFTTTEINLIVEKLRLGKVLVFPTDTIYGLSCLSLNKKALARISNIKSRENNKPFINLISSLKMAKEYAVINQNQFNVLKRIWLIDKRPTTVILKARKKLPFKMVSEEGAISLRLPKSDFLIKIIRKVGAPIISTSLNLSGKKPLRDLKNIKQIFVSQNKPDLVVDVGLVRRHKPSRLIDLRVNPPKIIRN